MNYESPIAAVILFSREDILTTSGGNGTTIPEFKDDNVRDDGWL